MVEDKVSEIGKAIRYDRLVAKYGTEPSKVLHGLTAGDAKVEHPTRRG